MILRNLRTSVMNAADFLSIHASLVAIGAGIWLQEKKIIGNQGGGIGGGITVMIIGGLITLPYTGTLLITSFLLNSIFYTSPIRKETDKASRLQSEAEKSRLAVNK
jgi:hypothetical protein